MFIKSPGLLHGYLSVRQDFRVIKLCIYNCVGFLLWIFFVRKIAKDQKRKNNNSIKMQLSILAAILQNSLTIFL